MLGDRIDKPSGSACEASTQETSSEDREAQAVDSVGMEPRR